MFVLGTSPPLLILKDYRCLRLPICDKSHNYSNSLTKPIICPSH